MKHFVVTVGCEYGSGGIEIGKMVAKSLGVEYYDRDLIDKVVEEIGVDRDLVKKADQGETVKYEFDTSFGPRYANLAPTEKRIQYVMEKKGLDHDKAAELVKYNDGMLSSRYNYMTGGDMRDCSMRDMMIDSSVLGLEKTAKYILQMIDLRFED